jgi:hypothetical protein
MLTIAMARRLLHHALGAINAVLSLSRGLA